MLRARRTQSEARRQSARAAPGGEVVSWLRMRKSGGWKGGGDIRMSLHEEGMMMGVWVGVFGFSDEV